MLRRQQLVFATSSFHLHLGNYKIVHHTEKQNWNSAFRHKTGRESEVGTCAGRAAARS